MMNRFLNRSTLCWTFVLVCLCISGAGTAFAFDGNRAGFILGIGAGGGYARDAVSIDSSDFGFSGFSVDVSQSHFAGKTDFLIGYAPSNRLAITWSSKVSWYSSDDLIANGTYGLGITYFLSEDINANFIQAVIGFNNVSIPFADKDEYEKRTWTGFGLGIGFGREVSKNWIIGLDATWGRSASESEDGFGLTTFGIGVYFSHIWY